jgi:hypothetical protein
MERGGLNQSGPPFGVDFPELWTDPAGGDALSPDGRSPSENPADPPPPVVFRCDQEIIYRSAALTACVQAATRSNGALILQTAADSRLSLSVTMLLSRQSVRWVVEIEGEFFDGVSGQAVSWTEDPTARIVDATSRGATDRRRNRTPQTPLVEQCVVSATLRHRASSSTELGRAAEELAYAFTGSAPSGWGADEPAAQLWKRANLTTLVRSRMPEPTTLAVASNAALPFVAQVTASRTDLGIDEDLVAVGLGKPHTTHDGLMRAFAELAADTTLAFALVHRRLGRADFTTGFGAGRASSPVAVLLGPRAVRDLGLDRLESAPLPAPQRLGPDRVPSLLWMLDPSPGNGWRQLDALARHVGPDRVATVTGGSNQIGRPATNVTRHG